MSTLYLCYFGLREPLVQTQVLPYLRQLAAHGIAVRLLTFEPNRRRAWSAADEKQWRQRLAADGIHWHALAYHKRPSLPATLFDILAGAWFAVRLARRERIAVFHGRGHVATTMGAIAKKLCGGRLLFDIRGFNPEEYVDAGLWTTRSLKYRLMKRTERWLLNFADGFVVLTEKAREILFPGCTATDSRGRPIAVIPCCVDFERFQATEGMTRDEARAALGLAGRRVLVYVGNIGGFYLTQEMVEFLALAHRRDPSTFSLLLTQGSAEELTRLLRTAGVPDGAFRVKRVPADQIPRYLAAADFGLSFIKPSYSKQAASPTKIAEYLASGLPVLTNAGVGDLDALIAEDRVGVLLHDLSAEGYRRALDEMEALLAEPDLADRCRESARRRFDLVGVGGARYLSLYERLLADPAQEVLAPPKGGSTPAAVEGSGRRSHPSP